MVESAAAASERSGSASGLPAKNESSEKTDKPKPYSGIYNFGRCLLRKKIFSDTSLRETKLSRCLGVFDLTTIGVGATIGAGVYVIIGQVIRNIAGPSIIVSFMVAGFTSALSGLCYAEFGARVPRAGSAYIYSYVTVGEIWAFVIGWNMLLEYIIGAASVGKALSNYVDNMADNALSYWFTHHTPNAIPGFSPYVDLLALAVVLIGTTILAFGVKESVSFNTVITAVNLLVILFIFIVGLFKANIHNWEIKPSEVSQTAINEHRGGVGGFFPFGFQGMMAGAATCFYAFIGFDAIAATGEEVKEPEKNLPRAIFITLIVSAFCYETVSIVLSLMTPYFTLDGIAPLPQAFASAGYIVAKYIIGVGACCSMASALLCIMYAMIRVSYSMAEDGLIFKFMSYVNAKNKIPIATTFVCGILTAIVAMLLRLKMLVEMMSIGTLLAYSLVCMCVMILRYKPDKAAQVEEAFEAEEKHVEPLQLKADELRAKRNIFARTWWPDKNTPDERTAGVVTICIVFLAIFIPMFSIVSVVGANAIGRGETWALVLFIISFVGILIIMVIISRQPENKEFLHFKAWGVPYVPVIAVTLNTHLMCRLSKLTWIRFAIWLAIGALIYFGYGIRKSSSEYNKKDVDIKPAEKNEKIPVLTEKSGLLTNKK